MAEGIGVSKYGTDLAGTLANRPSNAPAGVTFFATDTEQLFVSAGSGDNWVAIGTPTTGVYGATITVGTEAANSINVAIQLTDAAGNSLATVGHVKAYLSDAATGIGLTATAPDGDIAIGTDGAILYEDVADKVFALQSEADGDIDLDIGEAAGGTWYLVILLPNGQKVVSDAITFAA
jgi:hypothetical protein